MMIDINKDFFSDSVVGRVRQANEDSCGSAQVPNGFLFVVCDGMGGHVGGAVASNIGVHSILEYLSKELYADIPTALFNALHFANMQIIGKTVESPELKGMGTTACILLLNDNAAYIAHVGDSRIYLYCKKQQWLHRITKDHSYVQSLVDKGEITDAEAEHHPNKNRILRALGVKENLEPEVCVSPILPAKDDIFLICSDGLSGMLSDDKLQYVLQQDSSVQEKGRMMIDLANQEGGADNITAQLICTSKSPYTTSVFESKNPPERAVPAMIPLPQSPHKKIWIIVAATAAVLLILLGVGGIWRYKYEVNECEKYLSNIKKVPNLLGDCYKTYSNVLEDSKYFYIDSNVQKFNNACNSLQQIKDRIPNEKFLFLNSYRDTINYYINLDNIKNLQDKDTLSLLLLFKGQTHE